MKSNYLYNQQIAVENLHCWESILIFTDTM